MPADSPIKIHRPSSRLGRFWLLVVILALVGAPLFFLIGWNRRLPAPIPEMIDQTGLDRPLILHANQPAAFPAGELVMIDRDLTYFAAGAAPSRRPPPYPPLELYCVIEPGENGRLLFAALLSDLYNAEWVLHKPAHLLTPNERSRLLAQVGCVK